MKVSAKYFFGLAIPLFLFAFQKPALCSMNVSGTYIANNVVVTGDVSVSSMTISSLTVTSLLDVKGTYIGSPGRILQSKSKIITSPTSTTSSTFTAVNSATQTITLSQSDNYVRITVTGSLLTPATSYLTIYRDSINLGDANTGLLGIDYSGPGVVNRSGTGFVFLDQPGDTSSHTYAIYFRTTGMITFPSGTRGYLLLEEISD